MSLDHLLDGTCRLWTHTEGSGSLDADTWAVGETVACYLAPAEPGRLDTGAGMRDVRTRQLFLPLGAGIVAEQVVEMVTGPEAPSLWRVVAPPQRPRSHHTEAYVEPWHGTLPEEEEEPAGDGGDEELLTFDSEGLTLDAEVPI